MTSYLTRRFLLIIPVVFGATLIVFFALRLVPGDAIDAQISGSQWLSAEQKAQMRSQLGIDRPAVAQYGEWLGGILKGDFGRSFRSGEPTLVEIGSRLPLSVELALLSMLISIAIAVPVGVIAAVYRDKWFDYGVRTVSILGLAIPHFVLATAVVIFGASWFGWAAPLGYSEIFVSPWKNLQQVLPAAAVLGLNQSSISMRLVRSMMLEVLREDYVRTAWAKGLSSRTVVMSHSLRNALIPVVTVWGTSFGYLLAGQVMIEHIFRLPGIGALIVESLGQRDYPMLQSSVLVMAVAFALVNLAVDTTYVALDPRIRHAKA